MCLCHDRMRRVLTGADDEPRLECAARDAEWRIVHGAPAPDEIDDLDLVAVAHQRRGKRVTLDDHHVVFDGNAPGIDVQPFEQLLHGYRLLEIERVPVERNPHGYGLAEFYCTESDGWVRAESRGFRSFGTFVSFLLANDPNCWNDPYDSVRRVFFL